MSNQAVHGDSTPSYIVVTAIATLYKAFKLSTARNTVELAGAAEAAIGINTQTTVQASESVPLKRNGYALATVGTGNWSKGDKLTPESGGALIATTTAANLVCAIAMEAGTAAEFGEVLLLPYPVRYDSL